MKWNGGYTLRRLYLFLMATTLLCTVFTIENTAFLWAKSSSCLYTLYIYTYAFADTVFPNMCLNDNNLYYMVIIKLLATYIKNTLAPTFEQQIGSCFYSSWTVFYVTFSYSSSPQGLDFQPVLSSVHATSLWAFQYLSYPAVYSWQIVSLAYMD